MAFDVYQLSDQQIELGFLASDKGQMFGKDNKFLRLSIEDFRSYPHGDGRAILREGLRTNMLRKTKSGAYALFAKQVQMIVSVHPRPGGYVHTEPDVSSQFDALEKEPYAGADGDKEQPVLTYIGSGLAIVALLLSSFISSTGLVGLFTVALATIGFVLSLVGTVLFFKSIRPNTPGSSKIMHIVLTVISLVALGLLSVQTFFMTSSPDSVDFSNNNSVVDSSDVMANSTGEIEGGYVELSQEELRETLSFEYDSFTIAIEDSSLLKTGLPVSVTNTSDKQWVYNLTVEAYNVNGEKIGLSDHLLMAEIAPGETYNGVLFEYMTASDAEILVQDGVTFAVDHISVN